MTWTIATLLDPAVNPEAKYLQGYRKQLVADFASRSGYPDPAMAQQHGTQRADEVMQWICDSKNHPVLDRSIRVFIRFIPDAEDNRNYYVRVIDDNGQTASETLHYAYVMAQREFERQVKIHG